MQRHIPQSCVPGGRLAWKFAAVAAIALALPRGASAQAPATVDLELVTEGGLQITAPQEWLQLLAREGITQARIRSGGAGEPRIDNRGTEARPRYHVLGILGRDGRLRVPGKTFTQGQAAALKDYLDLLAADGTEGVTAPKGPFGLTERQLAALEEDLSRPIALATAGKRLNEVVDQVGRSMEHKILWTGAALSRATAAGPVADEVQPLSAGTGLAMLLHAESLGLRPEKPRGEPTLLRVVVLSDGSAGGRRGPPGRNRPPGGSGRAIPASEAGSLETWPVGWKSEAAPSQLAPAMFESLSAEIAGYTLVEALDAIQPRVKVPFFLDHCALEAEKIDPAAVQVNLARMQTYYLRILQRLLSQARLTGHLRVDERGTVFFWVTQ